MARAKSGRVQIRLTLLDVEGLSSRVSTESIQYEFMMVIISSLRTLVRTKSFRLTHICCPSAFTDENCGGMSWQELNQG